MLFDTLLSGLPSMFRFLIALGCIFGSANVFACGPSCPLPPQDDAKLKLEAAERKAEGSEPGTVARMQSLFMASIWAYQAEDFDKATELAEASYQQASILNDTEGIFCSVAMLSEIEHRIGEIGPSLSRLRKLQHRFHEEGDTKSEMRCLVRIAEQADRCSCWRAAIQFYTEAHRLAVLIEEHGEVIGIGQKLIMLYGHVNKLATSSQIAEQTLTYISQHGTDADRLLTLTTQTRVSAAARFPTEAAAQLSAFLDEHETALPVRNVALATLGLGESYLSTDQPALADQYFVQALRLSEKAGLFPSDLADLRTSHAHALIDLGQTEKASELLDAVLNDVELSENRALLADAMRQKSRIGDANEWINKSEIEDTMAEREQLERRELFLNQWTELVEIETDAAARNRAELARVAERQRLLRIGSIAALVIGIAFTAVFTRYRYERKLARDRERLAVEHGEHLQIELREQEIRLREQLQWRRSLERDLQRNERLESVGALASGVAHDFNNLMTVVISATETIGMVASERLRDREQEMLGEVLKAARSGAEITHQLLALTRSTDSDEATLINLDEFFEDILGLLNRTVGDDVDIVVRVTDAMTLVRADRSQFTSALINICSNARDAMSHSGHLDIRVDRVSAGAGNRVEIAVADDGCGMTTEDVEKADSLFFTTKSEGSGLGLSMVKKFVKDVGGEMAITSCPGEGSTVYLRLPVAQAIDATVPEHLSRPKRPPIDGLRVVVVDDKASVLSSVSTLLKDLGCAVTSFFNPEAARDALESGEATPDVVLSDIRMKGQFDGRGLATWIMQQRPNVAVILMTGHSEEEVENVPLLRKPFASDELISLLTQAVDQRERARSATAAKAS